MTHCLYVYDRTDSEGGQASNQPPRLQEMLLLLLSLLGFKL